MFRMIGDLVSPAGARGRLSMLFYHRTPAVRDPILHEEMDGASFERHMGFLAARFNVLTIGEAAARLERGTLPPRALCVSFDDGYADNAEVALPILQRLGMRATFFVATGYTAGGVMFNDAIIEAIRAAPAGEHDLSSFGLATVMLDGPASRRAAVDRLIAALKYRPPAQRQALVDALVSSLRCAAPRDLMMSAAQIARVHDAGMEIGAHTVTHPILLSQSDDAARAEIVGSKRALEDIIGAPVTVFAYPNGKPGQDYGPQHVRFVKEAGYAAAVSTVRGIGHAGSDRYQLPRIAPWDSDPRRLAARLLYMCARTGSGRARREPLPSLETNDPLTGRDR